MNNKFTRQDIDFYSHGIRCSAWLYLPTRVNKCPIIVMAHGLGSVREMRLDAYAEKFVDAGYACFLFDYRNFGASDGNKRQRINAKEQLEDWNSAIDFIKKDDRVDGNKILLFGSSFSGGHVITLSSTRKDIFATIAQCPYTNSLATLSTASPLTTIKVLPLILIDLLSCIIGYHPVTIKLAGNRGTAAAMAVPDYQGFLDQVPKKSTFVNKTPARTLLEFFKYSPSKYTKNIETPIYYAVCRNDTLAPAETTIEYAKLSKNATIKEYNCGHFEIYFDNFFDKAIINYINFFNKCLR